MSLVSVKLKHPTGLICRKLPQGLKQSLFARWSVNSAASLTSATSFLVVSAIPPSAQTHISTTGEFTGAVLKPFHGRCFILLLDGCSFSFSSETITLFFTQFNYFPHWGTRARGRTRLRLFIHRRWFSCWHALVTTLDYKNIYRTRSEEVTI